jgi:hypothetical protein
LTTEKFYPGEDDVTHWFGVLNEQIFGNKLTPFTEIEVKTCKKAHAFFHYNYSEDGSTKIQVHPYFKSRKLFVEIMAHEMVHKFQHDFGEPIGHGPSFWVWRDIFNLKGIDLHKSA